MDNTVGAYYRRKNNIQKKVIIMIVTKDNLTVHVFSATREMSCAAAQEVSNKIKELLKEKETINMLFAAAPSQSDFFKSLIESKGVEWNRINAFHLDEYIGLEKDATQRFGNFLKRELFDFLPFKSVYYLNGQEPLNGECERYAEVLNQYPTDIACIGIGENGHIAFNDPHVADFCDEKAVKIVELDQMCRQQQVNDGCFEKLGDVPTHALTLTIPTILSAPYIYCIVPYKSKAQAVYKTLNGDISENCPASVLRRKKGAMLFLDADSASLLAK